MNDLEHRCPLISKTSRARQDRHGTQIARSLANGKTINAVREDADLYSRAVDVKCASSDEGPMCRVTL